MIGVRKYLPLLVYIHICHLKVCVTFLHGLCLSCSTESSTSWERRTRTWWPERRGSSWWSLLRWSEWEPRKPPLSTSQTSANCEPCSRRALSPPLLLFDIRLKCRVQTDLFVCFIAGCIVSLNICLLSCWLSWEQGTSIWNSHECTGNEVLKCNETVLCVLPWKFKFLICAFFFLPTVVL